MNKIHRIIDANVNRVSEGLRVIEDVSRFALNDTNKTDFIRSLRHQLRDSLKSLDVKLINSRNVDVDFGVNFKIKDESGHDLLNANFKRIQEGLRSIEECLKTLNEFETSKKIEKIRFDSYSLEVMFSKKNLPLGLYCITASHLSNGRDVFSVTKAILDGGCKIIQYREKYKSMKEKYYEAEQLKKITDSYNATFIINDHPEIAMAIDADGVHIGQDDIPVDAVRKIVGNKIIGLSTHSPAQAKLAIESNIDYIGVGPIYETKTKDDVCSPVGLEYAEYAQKNVKIPFYTIGGIKENNLQNIMNLGIKRAVLVTEITMSPNITETVRRINETILNFGVTNEL